MKEISYEKAKALIEKGEAVKCQTTNRVDQFTMVHDLSKLNYLYELGKNKVQLCIFYPVKTKNNISEESIEISFDEAYNMLNAGYVVFYEDEAGGEETINDVAELISIRRSKESRGEKLLLRWHE